MTATYISPALSEYLRERAIQVHADGELLIYQSDLGRWLLVKPGRTFSVALPATAVKKEYDAGFSAMTVPSVSFDLAAEVKKQDEVIATAAAPLQSMYDLRPFNIIRRPVMEAIMNPESETARAKRVREARRARKAERRRRTKQLVVLGKLFEKLWREDAIMETTGSGGDGTNRRHWLEGADTVCTVEMTRDELEAVRGIR